MASSRRGRGGGGQRPQRVGEQIRQVLGDLLTGGGLKDPRFDGAELISFTEVRVTGDLRQARVFTSVFPPDGEGAQRVMEALSEHAPRIRSLVASEMRLRHTPELDFTFDGSIERGARMEALIREVRDEDEGRTEPEPEDSDS